MLKHILTHRCPRACDYCIARNVHISQMVNMRKLKSLYKELYDAGHKTIMLTGGEPTIAEGFTAILAMAYTVFDEVYLTTADVTWIDRTHARQWLIKAITFSAHDMRSVRHHVVRAEAGTTVYASILDHQYCKGLVQHLKDADFAGLTVNENQWGGPVFDESQLEEVEGFSTRLVRRGYCIKDNTPMILPDLNVAESFELFMGEPGAIHPVRPPVL